MSLILATGVLLGAAPLRPTLVTVALQTHLRHGNLGGLSFRSFVEMVPSMHTPLPLRLETNV